MIKKITASVATLALSVGILSTASAAELTQPSSPNPIQVSSSSNIITPYNGAQIYVQHIEWVLKTDKILPRWFISKEYNGSKYGGYVEIEQTVPAGSFYKVYYGGYIPKFIE